MFDSELFYDDISETRPQSIADQVYCGNVDALREMIVKHPDNINKPSDEDKTTPLHLACLFGHLDCVKVLLEHGADPLIKDSYGSFPVYYACLDVCLHGRLEIVQELLNAVKEVEKQKQMLNTPNIIGETPLHSATSWCADCSEMVNFLIQAGARPCRNINNEFPSHACCDKKAYEILKPHEDKFVQDELKEKTKKNKIEKRLKRKKREKDVKESLLRSGMKLKFAKSRKRKNTK